MKIPRNIVSLFSPFITLITVLLIIDKSQWTYSQPDSPQTLPLQVPSLQTLSSGEYYYQGTPSSELSGIPHLLLHKWGRIIIGIDARSPLQLICFKGFLDGNRITHATRVLPPYTPDAQWDYQPGEMIDLDQYERITNTGTEADRAALGTCLDVFSR